MNWNIPTAFGVEKLEWWIGGATMTVKKIENKFTRFDTMHELFRTALGIGLMWSGILQASASCILWLRLGFPRVYPGNELPGSGDFLLPNGYPGIKNGRILQI